MLSQTKLFEHASLDANFSYLEFLLNELCLVLYSDMFAAKAADLHSAFDPTLPGFPVGLFGFWVPGGSFYISCA